MEVTGVIKLVDEVKEISASFKKRDVIITTDEQYPQHITIQFVQDKTALLDAVKIGDTATIGINLRGREWTSPQGEVKYFNTIQGWRIDTTAANVDQAIAESGAPVKTTDGNPF